MRPLSEVLQQRHLPALDGLRAVAAFTVVAYHAGFRAVPGDLGVVAFFALSGFLITWLLLKEHDRTGTVSLRGFYRRRTLRIFPAYYAFIGLSVAADAVLGDPWSAGRIGAALTYTGNYFNAFHGHAAGHIWSLAVEEQFYLLWPALFLTLRSRGTRTLRAGILGIMAAVLVWRSALYFGTDLGATYVYNAFDTRFDSLLAGCLLAVLVTAPATVRILERTAVHWTLPLLTLAALVYSRTGISEGWHYSAGFTVNALLCTLLVVQLVQLSGHPVWRWLDHPLTRWLGAISYPIYLWHVWALNVGAWFGGTAVRFAIGSLLSIVLAAGSYYVIEKPFLRFKNPRPKQVEPRVAVHRTAEA